MSRQVSLFGATQPAPLSALYAYITQRLTQANLHTAAALLDECRDLMQPLRDAWTSIAAQVNGRPA